jgi:hypothetical protein
MANKIVGKRIFETTSRTGLSGLLRFSSDGLLAL